MLKACAKSVCHVCACHVAPEDLSYKPKDSYHQPWKEGIKSSSLITNPVWMSSCVQVSTLRTANSGEAVLSSESRGFEDTLDSADVVAHIISVNNQRSAIKRNCPVISFP